MLPARTDPTRGYLSFFKLELTVFYLESDSMAIFGKLNVKSRIRVVLKALKQSWVRLDEE